MKTLAFVLFAFFTSTGFSQKIGYIEIERILINMESFTQANEEIKIQAEKWEYEIKVKFEEVEELYQNYVLNESKMTDQQKKERQAEIFAAERQVNEFKDSKFGQQGELMILQETKLKPIYDSIYEVAENIAKRKEMDYLFEKSSESSWIYTNPQLDLTEEVMDALASE